MYSSAIPTAGRAYAVLVNNNLMGASHVHAAAKVVLPDVGRVLSVRIYSLLASVVPILS